MVNIRDVDGCPKCGRDSDFLKLQYVGQTDLIHVTCSECSYEFDAEPSDREPAEGPLIHGRIAP